MFVAIAVAIEIDVVSEHWEACIGAREPVAVCNIGRRVMRCCSCDEEGGQREEGRKRAFREFQREVAIVCVDWPVCSWDLVENEGQGYCAGACVSAVEGIICELTGASVFHILLFLQRVI